MRTNAVPQKENATARRGSDYDLLRLVKDLEWLRTLAHVSPVGIFRADARGLCSYVNERWSELTGYTVQTATGASWELAVHPDDAGRLRSEWRRCLAERVPFRIEHRFLQPSGRVVWALTQVVRDVDGSGRVTGYTGTSTDITELHRMRVELQDSHADLELRIRDRTRELQRTARIVEVSDDAIVQADMEGRVVTWNRGAQELFGYTAAEMIGQTTLILAPENKRDEAEELKRRVFAGEDIHHFETMRVSKSGELLDVSLSIFGLRDDRGNITGTWGLVRNISDLKRAERRLQRLSWRLLRVQDEERRRIARDLHDSTAQSLAALSMNLSMLAREDAPLSEARRRQLLQDSMALADLATSELRTTSYLLHPPLLEESGLPAAIGWLVTGFSERSRIEVKLDITGEIERLPIEVETAFFRVVQESLHNVHRHSGSATAEIQLTRDETGLRLAVRDHGSGPPESLGEGIGVGIAGMKERMLQLGGMLTIEANHPGTTVIAWLPVEP